MTLVSAIMPTRGRADWAAQALECFVRQTWPERELIILDDEEDPSFPHSSGDIGELVRYFRSSGRLNVSIKRNTCCRHARGQVIAHWDSDDWSAPDRLDDQMALLESSGKAVAGYHSMFFYDERSGHVYRYAGAANYAIGTSLCYLRAWWEQHPFDESLELGEDNRFVYEARGQDQLVTIDAERRMVARIHSANTYTKAVTDSPYRLVPQESIPEAFLTGG